VRADYLEKVLRQNNLSGFLVLNSEIFGTLLPDGPMNLAAVHQSAGDVSGLQTGALGW
jgi:hypothetical protein